MSVTPDSSAATGRDAAARFDARIVLALTSAFGPPAVDFTPRVDERAVRRPICAVVLDRLRVYVDGVTLHDAFASEDATPNPTRWSKPFDAGSRFERRVWGEVERVAAGPVVFCIQQLDRLPTMPDAQAALDSLAARSDADAGCPVVAFAYCGPGDRRAFVPAPFAANRLGVAPAILEKFRNALATL